MTGAAAGIGRATARRFAAEGCRVAAFDVNDAAAEPLAAELAAAGGPGLFATVNVTDAASVEAGVEAVVERWGRIDVLVNNAGILRDGSSSSGRTALVQQAERRGVGRRTRRQPQGRLPLHARRRAAHDRGRAAASS